MKIHVGWGNEEEDLLLWKFENGWTEQDYYESHELLTDMCASKVNQVDVIIDLRRVIKAPPNILPIVRHAAAKRPGNARHVVFLVASTFWKRIFDMEKLVTPRSWQFSYHFAATVDEAYDLIDSARLHDALRVC